MEKRLKNYLKYIESMVSHYEKLSNEGTCADVADETELNDDNCPSFDLVMEDLFKQIEYFQHERHMHLIVTMTFAIMTLMCVLMCMFLADSDIAMCIPLWAFPLVFMVLLIPYIRHYYILENGVQKLYEYYDRLMFLKR